jgi:hypothetical protein
MLEVFADILCPFTHVGLRKVVERRDAVGSPTRIRTHAWPLEWVNGVPVDPAKIAAEIEALRGAVTPDRFRGFDPGTFPATSVPALALAALAYERDLVTGETFSLAVRDALFEEGRDVSTSAVLDDLAGRLGLDRAAANVDRVRADYAAGRQRGVVGSPYFLVAGEGFFCPALDIAQVDGRFAVSFDAATFDDFVERALEMPG